MNYVPRIVRFLGVVGLFTAATAVADAPSGDVRVEAVVRSYEIAAMEDIFDGGRVATYDAVTLKVLTPASLANTVVRVYFESGSTPNDSPLLKPGRRCAFDFDKKSSKRDQLFRGFLKKLHWIDAVGAAADHGRGKSLASIDGDLLDAIAKELGRLEANAKSEAGPKLDHPSQHVAYYLLAGLAVHGESLESLSEAEQRLFDVERRGGRSAKLMSVFADVRVSLIDQTIQDKGGSYLLKTAALYVHQEGKWAKRGSGVIVADSILPGP